MSTRVWWALVITMYVGLLIWLLVSLDPSTVCSATQPC